MRFPGHENVPSGLLRATRIPQMYMSTERVQSRIIVTENETGHWGTAQMFEGGYDNPRKSSEDVTESETHRLRFGVYVVNNYIPPSVVNGRIPY